ICTAAPRASEWGVLLDAFIGAHLSPAYEREIGAHPCLFTTEGLARIGENKYRAKLRTDGMSGPTGSDHALADRVAAVGKRLIKPQAQPIPAPIFEPKLAYHGRAAGKVAVEPLVFARLVQNDALSDEP